MREREPQREPTRPNVLPESIRTLFLEQGYGCLAMESDDGIIHVCHAADRDITSFAAAPVRSQWQLIEMPTAPLIRLTLVLLDDPANPFQFESFLNVAEPDQTNVLTALTMQEELTLAFYGDDLTYRYTKQLYHSETQRAQLAAIGIRAMDYWQQLPSDERDFILAKDIFMRHYS